MRKCLLGLLGLALCAPALALADPTSPVVGAVGLSAGLSTTASSAGGSDSVATHATGGVRVAGAGFLSTAGGRVAANGEMLGELGLGVGVPAALSGAVNARLGFQAGWAPGLRACSVFLGGVANVASVRVAGDLGAAILDRVPAPATATHWEALGASLSPGLLCGNQSFSLLVTPTGGVTAAEGRIGRGEAAGFLNYGARGAITIGREFFALAEVVRSLSPSDPRAQSTDARLTGVYRLNENVALYAEASISDRSGPTYGGASTGELEGSVSGGVIVSVVPAR